MSPHIVLGGHLPLLQSFYMCNPDERYIFFHRMLLDQQSKTNDARIQDEKYVTQGHHCLNTFRLDRFGLRSVKRWSEGEGGSGSWGGCHLPAPLGSANVLSLVSRRVAIASAAGGTFPNPIPFLKRARYNHALKSSCSQCRSQSRPGDPMLYGVSVQSVGHDKEAAFPRVAPVVRGESSSAPLIPPTCRNFAPLASASFSLSPPLWQLSRRGTTRNGIAGAARCTRPVSPALTRAARRRRRRL